ncbi:ABC transporter substrate-binding protein [Halotalea alkalilenta]|nr:ABC transporter substrate-binding protein [Halotalea alkalilenta]
MTHSQPARSRTMIKTAALAALLGASNAAWSATPPDTLVMAWNIDAISTFDPAQIGEVVTNEILMNTCSALVDYDPEDATQVVPALAESWEVNEDERSLTFHLRDGLTFPSGEPVEADDLAWSLARVVKLGFGNAATLEEYGFTTDNVEQLITAPDPRTLVIRFDRPYPSDLMLQAIAANRVATAIDRDTVMAQEVDGDLGNRYLTTRTECAGPYRLRQWNAGEAVVLEANSGWTPAPALSRVLIRHVAEPGTQRLLLSRGDVDVARDLTPEDLAAVEAAPDLEINKALRPQLFYWGFNNDDPILSNQKVRQALQLLVDYQGLADTVMSYSGIPRASFVPLESFGALDQSEGQPFSQDLDRARELLVEAGYPDGFSMRLIFGTLPYSATVAQSLQNAAAQIGINLELERMANAQLFSRVRGREYQMSLQSWQTSVADAHGMASRLIYNPDNRLEARNTMYPSWNSAFYSEQANQEIEEALFETDPAAREQRYHALQREVFELTPRVVLFQTYNIVGLNQQLKGWQSNGFRSYYTLTSK